MGNVYGKTYNPLSDYDPLNPESEHRHNQVKAKENVYKNYLMNCYKYEA